MGGAIAFDASSFPTGFVKYDLNAGFGSFSGQQLSGSSQLLSGVTTSVNSVGGEFGNGWGVAGLQEITIADDTMTGEYEGAVLLTDGNGQELVFRKPTDGSSTYINPDGDFSTLELLADGTFQRTLKNQTIYKFNAENQLESVTDRNENQTSYEYEATNNRLLKIMDPIGLETTFDYVGGKLNSTTSPDGRKSMLDVDGSGNLREIMQPDSSTMSFAYDQNNLMTLKTDELQNTTRMYYDNSGRLEGARFADYRWNSYQSAEGKANRLGGSDRECYLPNAYRYQAGEFDEAYLRDGKGNVSTFKMNEAGAIIEQRDSVGVVAKFNRDSNNLVTKSFDGQGNSTSYRYDALGNHTVSRDLDEVSESTNFKTHEGTDFWLTFLRQGEESTNNQELLITSRTSTEGTVSIPGLGFSETFQVEPGIVSIVLIPAEAKQVLSDQVHDVGIHVTSQDDISVTGGTFLSFNQGTYLALPTDVIGDQYVLTTSANYTNTGGSFAIVGTKDDTRVTITPSVETGVRPANIPFEISLNAGEAYYLENMTLNKDLTGTLVDATAPVSVFGGHPCGVIPDGVSFCDDMLSQLLPVEYWSTEFVTVPFATRVCGDTFKVVAAEDGTEVSVDGSIVAT